MFELGFGFALSQVMPEKMKEQGAITKLLNIRIIPEENHANQVAILLENII